MEVIVVGLYSIPFPPVYLALNKMLNFTNSKNVHSLPSDDLYIMQRKLSRESTLIAPSQVLIIVVQLITLIHHFYYF